MALFELRGVTMQRAGAEVLRGLTLEIPAGSACIAGPSGSGKSSLLRLLNRLSEPTHGEVLYQGRPIGELDPLALRREVCLVPQLPALIDGTVADNLRFAHQLGDPPDPLGTARIGALLDLAGLDPSFADRPADRLSVGEQQRAMLARALAVEPSVLLLDEPTSALDEAARETIERTIAHLRDRIDVSIVLVTHDLGQARRLADWVIRLDRGKLRDVGVSAEVLGA